MSECITIVSGCEVEIIEVSACEGGGATTFLLLADTPGDYTGQEGKLIKVNPTGDALIFGDPSGSSVSWGDVNGTLSNQTDLQNILDAKAESTHNHAGIYEPANANIQTHISDVANPHGVTKVQVGLTNVDDTSDADKPISTLTQATLDNKEDSFAKNTGFNKDLGAIAGTVCEGNDFRLSDARTPLSHLHVEADISDLNKFTQAEVNALLTALDDINEDDLGTPAADGYVLSSTIAGARSWVPPATGVYEPVFTKNTAFNKDFGVLVGTVCEGNDGRLSDARTPTAHAHVEADISDLDKYTQAAVDAALGGKENAFSKNTAFNKDFGSIVNTVCEGNDARLSDARTPTAHTHLEVDITDLDKFTQSEVTTLLLGKSDLAHNHNADYDSLGSASTVQGNLNGHIGDVNNPHSTTKTHVGLGSVDNTSDVDKLISNLTQTALDGKEDDLGNPAANDYVLSSQTDGTRSWVAPVSGGVTAFLGLSDTPVDYTGQQGKLVKVNATEDGLIYGDPSGASVSWGDILGTLSAQTDLQAALDAKVDDSQVLTDVPAGAVFTDTDDHTNLSNIGTNTHTQIDTHLANNTIHFTMTSINITESQVSDLGSYALDTHNHTGVYSQTTHNHTGVYSPTTHNHNADYDALGAASTVQSNLDTHTANVTNPHSVTAAQVGAVGNDDSEAGASSVLNAVYIGKAAHTALIGSTDPDTLYFISGP